MMFRYIRHSPKTLFFTGSAFTFSASILIALTVYFAITPQEIDPDGLTTIKFLFLSMATLELFLASIAFWKLLTLQKVRRRLTHSGQKIEARVTDVRQLHNVTINNKNPWVIDAVWNSPYDGKEYTFHSRMILRDPRKIAELGTIIVTIDLQQPHKYMIDVDQLFSNNS